VPITIGLEFLRGEAIFGRVVEAARVLVHGAGEQAREGEDAAI